MTSKISLLSSVKPEVRNDLVLGPMKVLDASIAEFFLTRSELMHMVFSQPTSQSVSPGRRCPHCKSVVTVKENSFSHHDCPVSRWLVNSHQFYRNESTYMVPSCMAIDKVQSDYIRKIIELDSQRKLIPYIARSSHDFKVIALDSSGTPKTLAQIGSRPVAVTSMPGAYSHSTSPGPSMVTRSQIRR